MWQMTLTRYCQPFMQLLIQHLRIHFTHIRLWSFQYLRVSSVRSMRIQGWVEVMRILCCSVSQGDVPLRVITQKLMRSQNINSTTTILHCISWHKLKAFHKQVTGGISLASLLLVAGHINADTTWTKGFQYKKHQNNSTLRLTHSSNLDLGWS